MLKQIAMGLTLAFSVSACVPIPVYYVADHSRENVKKEQFRFVRIGHTTREQIIMRLGEPDAIKPDHSQMRYRLSRVVLVGVPLVQGAKEAPMIEKHEYTSFVFDENGVVTKMKRKSEGDWVL